MRGKTHFTEAFVATNSSIKEVEVNESLKENYSRLAERAQKLSVDTEQTIKELNDLKEKYEGEPLLQKLIEKEIKQVKSGRFKESVVSGKPRLWKFPIARINDAAHLNQNHRAYTLPLWENVMNKQKDLWQGFCGLADHPGDEEDPSIKNSSIVWLDMAIDPVSKLVYGIGSFVGPLGHTFEEIIDVGGKIGFSSSGFGDLMPDGFTVDPDTYEIERLADIVINPSQSVWGDASDAENSTEDSTIEYTRKTAVKEAKSKILGSVNMNAVDATKLNENVVDPAPTQLNESTEKKSIMSRVEEKAWRQYVTNFMENAENIENPTKRLSEMVDILSLFEEGIAPDLREQFEEKIVEEREKLEKMVESTVKANKEAGTESVDELLEGAKRLASEGLQMKEHIVSLDEVCNSLKEKVKSQEKEISVLNTKLQFRENKIASLKKQYEKLLVENGAAADKVDENNGKIKQFIEAQNKKINELQTSNQKLMEANDKMKRRYDTLIEKANEFRNNAKANGNVAEELREAREEIENYKSIVTQLQNTNQKLAESVAQVKTTIEQRKIKEAEERSQIVDYQPRYAERVSGTFNFRENNGVEIESYWQDQLERYGEAIKPFEKQIRGAKTLREAQGQFLKHFDEICEPMRVYNESRLIPTMNNDFNYNRLKEAGMIMPDQMTTEDVNQLAAEARAQFGIN